MSVRDSAGVTIVESSAPSWGEGEGWSLSREPRLSIGILDGPEEYTLFRVRDAVMLDNGRIAVTNTGTSEVRFFDGHGAFLGASGAKGEGPGEFKSMGHLWRAGRDSLVVYDYALRRFTVLDTAGEVIRNFPLREGHGGFAFPHGAFADGTILASVDEQDQGNYSELGIVRGKARFDRYDREGSPLRSLASLPGGELYKGTYPDGSGFTTSADHAVRTFAAVGPSSWFYGPGDVWEFQERDRDGRLLKLIRLDRPRRAMPSRVRVVRDSTLRQMNPQAARLWGSIPLPDSLPVHADLAVDAVGDLWVRGYVVLDEAPFWSVIDTAGRWLGDLHLPRELRITDIGEDYLMGVWTDSLGVQQVRLYGLDRDARRPESDSG